MVIKKHDLDDDDNIEIPDGGSVRVRLDLMDAMQKRFATTFDAHLHQPGYRTARTADAASHDRAAARLQYIADLQSAWMSPAQRSNTVAARDHDSTTLDADPIAARDAMIEQLTNAWRSPPRDAAPDDDPDEDDPDAAANAEQARLERWQGRDPSDVARDVERRRRAVHAEFAERLSNAWRAK